MRKSITLPQDVQFVLDRLEQSGYEGFIVGGCVRDALLDKTPSDWDVTTNALPEALCEIFSDLPTITIGKQHGTVAVVLHGHPIEITTYRIEGDYHDHRHPSSVSFTTSLREDLARRDFTINAMAYHPKTGLIDCFGGIADLLHGKIRTVGDPTKRFQEDGLRILRGLRFAGQLSFSIMPETKAAMRSQCSLLRHISPERIQAEFCKLLCSPGCSDVLRENSHVIFSLFPELHPMEHFLQNTPYHCFDVWEHTLHAIAQTPPDLTLRFTMLLHDSGKPAVYIEDEQGVGHFPGHAKYSTAIAEQITARLRMDNKTSQRICLLVRHHDLVLQPEEKWIKRQLNRFGQEVFFQLLAVHRSDTLAQSARCQPRLQTILDCAAIAREILAQQQCFQLRDLAVNGKDLLALGIPPGPELGQLLNQLLAAVIDGAVPNEKEPLLALIRKKWN
ncbi:MAG: HD domain-containing protein [Oscillospiraceae bacterium]|nr:HD domain-containing protein [Oscillospiraceae bacterium]